jgi:hypothetical protein
MNLQDKILMNGFSASGTFANRFTALYPNKIAAIAVGGVNGMTILPLNQFKGQKLIYQVGITDIQEIAGIDFQLSEFAAVPQYYYMGAEDDNDTLPFSDAFDDISRKLVLDVLGKDMNARWKKCEEIYDSLEINATFHTYPNIGHDSGKMDDDLILFFKSVIEHRFE